MFEKKLEFQHCSSPSLGWTVGKAVGAFEGLVVGISVGLLRHWFEIIWSMRSIFLLLMNISLMVSVGLSVIGGSLCWSAC